MSPPAINRYEKLKTVLVWRLSASQERKVKQLLMHEEPGDRKPSQFLRHRQGLAGPTVPEDFVRTIWCSRLPTSIQPLLASQPNSTLEALAELADRVQDIVAPASHVAATLAAGPSVSEMAADIVELKRAMKDLTLQLRDSRSRNRSHSRGRDARPHSRNRSSTRSDSSYQQHPVCSYHAMHGEKAKRCVKPCDYRDYVTAYSLSGMFAEARADCFHITMRKRCASLVRRVRGSSVLAMIAGRFDCPYIGHCCSRHVASCVR